MSDQQSPNPTDEETPPAGCELPTLDAEALKSAAAELDDDDAVLDAAELDMEPEGSDTDDPVEDDLTFLDDDGEPVDRAAVTAAGNGE